MEIVQEVWSASSIWIDHHRGRCALCRDTTTQVTEIDSPAKMPDLGRIVKIEEPAIRATILTPEEHLGGILHDLHVQQSEKAAAKSKTKRSR